MSQIISKPTREQFDQYMVSCYAPLPFILEKGVGCELWDQQGKHYIDFTAGIAVNSLGHGHPKILETLQKQASKIWHLSNLFTNEPALELAQKLTELTFAEKIFFCNSGAEANEAALKLARRVAFDHSKENNTSLEKTEIIAFYQGFHGRTFFTVSVGGQEKYAHGFGPHPQDITHLLYNDITTFSNHISDKTCAVIVETIQGEGGIIEATGPFLQCLRQKCHEHKALLIFDEVQTGNSRTGALYNYQNTTVVPDILTTAKGLGAGFPIGAMLTTTEIAQHFTVGVHGSTFGGNPLACAVAKQTLDLLSDPILLAQINQRSLFFKDQLNQLNQKINLFKEIRGQGLLIGAELNEEWQDKLKDIYLAAASHGVLILTAGHNVLRFTPPLLISEQEIEQGIQRLQKAILSLE